MEWILDFNFSRIPSEIYMTPAVTYKNIYLKILAKEHLCFDIDILLLDLCINYGDKSHHDVGGSKNMCSHDVSHII